MSNVLPEEAKKKIWRMYRARFFIAGSLIAILAAAAGALALMPSFFALAENGQAAGSPGAPGSSIAADRAAIGQGQALLSALAPFLGATTSPAAAIARALSLRPAHVEISSISYAKGTPDTIILGGSADAPKDIDAYRRALSSDPYFTTVLIPVADLAGAESGRFSVTLSGDF